VNEALRFSARLYHAVLILMGIQIVVTLCESGFDLAYTLPNHDLTASYVHSHLEHTSLPLNALTAFISLFTIYLLIVSERMMKKVTDKNDPFANTYLLAMTLAFIDL